MYNVSEYAQILRVVQCADRNQNIKNVICGRNLRKLKIKGCAPQILQID